MAKITKESVKDCMRGSALTLATLVGVLGGVAFGFILRSMREPPEGEKGSGQCSHICSPQSSVQRRRRGQRGRPPAVCLGSSDGKHCFLLSAGWSEREVMYISLLGRLFLRMLKALILPLIIPSLIAAVGSLDMGLSSKVRERELFQSAPRELALPPRLEIGG